MKTLFSAIATLVLSCATLFAAPAVEELENSQFKVSIGDVAMIVDAAHGGKILSFTYQGTEIISQMTRMNSFGSTFWTSPQAEWNWPPVPEYDNLPYSVEEQGTTLKLKGQVSERFKYRICKEFYPDPVDNAIVVTYTIINESDQERQVAPWEITRVPNDGVVFFQAPIEAITPADLLPFHAMNGIALYAADSSERNRKINANGKGWYVFANEGLMLMKRFQDLEEGEEAPREAEIQVYVNEGKTFMELECQGPYTTLKPGESLHWSVRWYLMPMNGPAMPGMGPGMPGMGPGGPGMGPGGPGGRPGRPGGAPGQRPGGRPGGPGMPGMGPGMGSSGPGVGQSRQQ